MIRTGFLIQAKGILYYLLYFFPKFKNKMSHPWFEMNERKKYGFVCRIFNKEKNKQQKSRINRVFDKLRNNYLSNI